MSVPRSPRLLKGGVVLMDGVVTKQEVTPGSDPSHDILSAA